MSETKRKVCYYVLDCIGHSRRDIVGKQNQLFLDKKIVQYCMNVNAWWLPGKSAVCAPIRGQCYSEDKSVSLEDLRQLFLGDEFFKTCVRFGPSADADDSLFK
jgi:hypothetical protein